MAEVFEWNTEVHGYIKPSSIFDDDADYYPAFVRVYRYFIFEHTKRDILNNYRRNLPPSKTASEVEDILLSEYDESRLNTFKHSASHRGILYKLVAYIKARNYDKLDLSPIPYETYQWLEHNNILHNPKTRSSGNSDERSSKGFTWGVFILIFITIQLVVFLSRDDSPDYSSYDQNRRDEWLKEATDQKTYDEFKQQIPSTKVKLEGFDRSSAIPSDRNAPSPIGNDLK